MQAETQVLARVRFGAFELEVRTGELRRTGTRIHLPPQPFKLLVLLLSQPGRLVTREELRREIWGDQTFVDFEHGLNFAIKKIRDTLGDDAEHPRFIGTLPRRGYRFIAPVEWLVADEPTRGVEAPANRAGTQSESEKLVALAHRSGPGAQRWWRRAIILTAGGLVLLSAITVWILFSPASTLRITGYTQLTHDRRFKDVAGADTNRIFVNTLDRADIAIMPLGGGELVPIPIALPGEDIQVAGLAFQGYPVLYELSPDGSSLLSGGPGHTLWSVGVAGNPVHHLGKAENAAWSPDGKFIVYTWLGDIFVMQKDGIGARRLLSAKSFSDGVQSISDLRWSHDGGRIRFTRNHEIWEISSSGANAHRLMQGWRPSSWKCCGALGAGWRILHLCFR